MAEPGDMYKEMDVVREQAKSSDSVSLLEVGRRAGSPRAEALFDTVATVLGAPEIVATGAQRVGKEVSKAATELVDSATELAIPALKKGVEVTLWVTDTRDRLSQQAFERTDKYLEKVNQDFDKAMTKTDKIGWKPLRNLVQTAVVLAKSTREAVAEVNDIVPRLVDRKSYGDDIKGTYNAVRAVVAEHAQTVREQRVRSEDVVIRQALERNAKHMDKADEHKAKAADLRAKAQAARGI